MLWEYDAESVIGDLVFDSRNYVVFGTGRGMLHSVDLATGQSHWAMSISPFQSILAEVGLVGMNGTEFLLAGSMQGQVSLVENTAGKLIWSVNVAQSLQPKSAVQKDANFEMEKSEVCSFSHGGYGSINGVVVACDQGAVLTLDYSNGNIVSQFEMNGPTSNFAYAGLGIFI